MYRPSPLHILLKRLSSLATLFIFLASASLAGAGEVSTEQMRAAFGPCAAAAVQVKAPPALDGDLKDAAWGRVAPLDLRYIDARVPGLPRDRTRLRVACDETNLYLAFECRETVQGSGPEGLKPDDAAILKGNHIGALLDLGAREGPRFLLMLATPRGVTYTASRKEDATAWDAAWELEGLEVKVQTYVERWTAEFKLPLQGALAKPPKLLRATFLRNRFQGSKRAPDMSYFNYLQAWRPLLPVKGERKEREIFAALETLDLPAGEKLGKDFFGRLYLPVGDLESEECKKIPPAAPAPALPRVPSEEPPPGFEVSEKELVKLYGGPVLLVPQVQDPPAVDGDPGDAVWAKTPGFTLGYLLEDLAGVEEQNPTQIKVVSDAENLYLLAVCQEQELGRLRANDEALWTNDVLDFIFDAGHHHDYSAYYQIESNAKGRQALIHGRADTRWQPAGLVLKTKIAETYWAVELKLAFKDFGLDPRDFPKLWGANFSRTRWAHRPGEDDKTPGEVNWDTAWRPNPHGTLHVPTLLGHLYLQAGRSVPPELAEKLKAEGKDLAKLGLKSYEVAPPPPAPVEEPVLRVAKFTQKPEVKVEGRKAVLTFAVEKPVDAAALILDEKGQVVRHLAAGVLGPHPPEPLQADALAQTLVWDFKDDQGKDVAQGAYTARVSLGLGAEFDRVLLWTPYEFRDVCGLATGPDGTLYVLNYAQSYGGQNFSTVLAYDREGAYVRQVYPFPGDQAAEGVSGASVTTLSDGSWIPTLYHSMQHSFLPWTALMELQAPAVSKQGRLLFVSSGSRQFRTPKRLLSIGVDGRVPADFAGPVIASQEVKGRPAVALSPDEKFVYVTGMSGRNLWPPRGGEPHHVVYRFRWDDPAPPAGELLAKPFLGALEERGSGKDRFNHPRGLDVDAAGNLYVADHGNGRVAIFDPQGAFLTEFPVEMPEAVRVHPKSGAVYVLSNLETRCRLTKFKDKGGARAGELDLPAGTSHKLLPGGSRGVLALDSGGAAPRLWVAYGRSVLQLEDAAEGLVNRGDVIRARRDAKLGPSPRPLARMEFTHHPENLELYLRADGQRGANAAAVYDGNSGAHVRDLGTEVAPLGFDFAHVGPDGCIYTLLRDGVHRYDRAFKPLNFEALDSPVLKTKVYRYGNGDYSTFCVSARGEIAVVNAYEGVSSWSLEGKPLRKNFVTGLLGFMAHIVRLDARGSLYLGTTIRRPDELIPRELQGRIPWKFGFDAKPQWHYEHVYGSALKFKPEGGKILQDPKGELLLGIDLTGFVPCTVERMEWLRFGFAPRMHRDTENANCNCEQGNFDLDRFDRLFVPNAPLFHIQVVDRNNNPIARLGRYGNMDACGPHVAPKDSKLAFAWPMTVSVDDKYMYVGDPYNDRIVRARLTYMEEAEAKVK